MPDWSYHGLFKPLLDRMRPERARWLTLSAVGLLGRLPLGSGLKIMEWMGHMAPPPELKCKLGGLTLCSPVGLAAAVDPKLHAVRSFTRFGFGLQLLGAADPKASGQQELRAVLRDPQREALCYSRRTDSCAPEHLLRQLAGLAARGPNEPLRGLTWVAADAGPPEEARRQQAVQSELSKHIDFWTMDACAPSAGGEVDEAALRGAVDSLRRASRSKPWMLQLYLDTPLEQSLRLVDWAKAEGAAAIWLDDTVQEAAGVYVSGRCQLEQLIGRVRALQVDADMRLPIITAGAVTEPEEALRLQQAGASLVVVHSGLIYSGPGLPKRINELLAQEAQKGRKSQAAWQTEERATLHGPKPIPVPEGRIRGLEAATSQLAAASTDVVALRRLGEQDEPPEPSGFWRQLSSGWGLTSLLGLGMVIGGMLAWWIAATTIVLPYDLAYVGMTREQLEQINDRLLPFMMHDRLTLAGTMLSIGILYLGLAMFAMRRSLHYARQTVLVSAAVGFLSFFLFLGFEYFDPLHALAALILLPFFVLGMWRSRRTFQFRVPPVNRLNDARWREGLRGQLAFVMLGFSLVIGGAIISLIGMGVVFVPEDLLYLCTTSVELAQQNERLISLVAHDRAGFGGALLSMGLGVLLLSLWGFRQGERWIWWTLALAGMSGLASAFGVHFAIGYVDAWHLLPPFIVLLLYLVGLKHSYLYLHATAE